MPLTALRARIAATARGLTDAPEPLAALDAALDRWPAGDALVEARHRLIAIAKAVGRTGERPYNDALLALNEPLKDPATAPDVSTGPLLAYAPAERAARRERAESAVVRWEWATGPRHALLPFFFERYRESKGRKLAAAPADPPTGTHGYGLDAEGRVRVEHHHAPQGPTTTYFDYADTYVEALRYDESGAATEATRHLLEDGRMIATHTSAPGRVVREDYTWDGPRLVEIRNVWWSRSQGRVEDHLAVTWDAQGPVTLDTVGIDTRPNRWRRPARGQSLAAVLAEVRERLLVAVPAAVARLQLDSPAYALCLAINGEQFDHLLPPSLGIGLARERDAFVAEHGAEAAYYVFSPVEWSTFEQDELFLEDEGLLEACARANQLVWAKEKHAQAEKLVHDVARALNAVPLALSATDDFLVYACDFTVADGVDGALRAAGPQRKKELRRWLASLGG